VPQVRGWHMKRTTEIRKIRLNKINPAAIVLSYLITFAWLACPFGLVLSKGIIAQLAFGVVFIAGFIIFVTRGKNLRHIKLSATGVEIYFSGENKKNPSKI
jgi:hypothetical protein